ncbi:MAG: hypothetical protein AB7E79_06065 [Rhodospirillaceae bacterium]
MSGSLSSRHLRTLTTSELFLLCSLRLTVEATRGKPELEKTCREGFEIARLTPADSQHLIAAVRAMGTTARRPIDVRTSCSPHVGLDEELILQVVLLLQYENEFGARRVLWRLLPPAAARVVLGHLEEVALGMARAGLHLPQLPYPLRPCPAEALAARQLGISPALELTDMSWLN